MRRREQAAGPPDLQVETVAVLLGGWCAEPPVGVPRGPHGFGGGFLELYDIGGIAKMWREHEAWLREHARVWGWEPRLVGPDGVRRFYAEAAVWENDRGEPAVHGGLRLHRKDREPDDEDPEDDAR
jgi:hypothetical protein